MEIKERKLKGVFEITLTPHIDNRGFFMRTFDENIFANFGINYKWVQENHARSNKKGIVRGLHFQLPPFTETKFVRCVKGKIIDVFVDLRKNSPTFGEWDSIVLSEENKKGIVIPRGFAHGYCTLTEFSDVLYKVDNYYHPEAESAILWNDPDININWPVKNPIISKKDSKNICFKEFKQKYFGLEV